MRAAPYTVASWAKGRPATLPLQAEEVAEPGCESARVFGDEEGDVVALAQGVGVAAGGGADPAAPECVEACVVLWERAL